MEFRYSRNILLYLHFVSTKRLIFCCWWGIIFGRKKLVCWKISVWLQKLCIFRVFFFLEWLKSCSSSVLLIIVLIRVLVMESLQAGTQKALDLNACKWEEMKLKLRSSSSCDSQGRRKFHSFCSFGTCWSSQAICFSMTCDQHHPSMSAHEYNCCLLQLGQYCEIPVQGFIQEVEIIKNNFFPLVPCVRFGSVTVFHLGFLPHVMAFAANEISSSSEKPCPVSRCHCGKPDIPQRSCISHSAVSATETLGDLKSQLMPRFGWLTKAQLWTTTSVWGRKWVFPQSWKWGGFIMVI